MSATSSGDTAEARSSQKDSKPMNMVFLQLSEQSHRVVHDIETELVSKGIELHRTYSSTEPQHSVWSGHATVGHVGRSQITQDSERGTLDFGSAPVLGSYRIILCNDLSSGTFLKVNQHDASLAYEVCKELYPGDVTQAEFVPSNIDSLAEALHEGASAGHLKVYRLGAKSPEFGNQTTVQGVYGRLFVHDKSFSDVVLPLSLQILLDQPDGKTGQALKHHSTMLTPANPPK